MKVNKIQENGYEIEDLHDSDYFRFKAISSHGMIDVIKADYDVEVAMMPKNLPQRSLEMGSIIHGAILEPERIDEIVQENYTSLIMPDDMGTLLKMLYASINNDEIRNALKTTKNELTLLHTRDGKASIKGKTDAIDVEKGIIYDVKSISRLKYYKNHIRNFGYGNQASLYTRLAELVYGKPFQFVWFFVSKDLGDIAIVEYEKKDEHLEEIKKAIEAFDYFNKDVKFEQFPTEKKPEISLF